MMTTFLFYIVSSVCVSEQVWLCLTLSETSKAEFHMTTYFIGLHVRHESSKLACR